MIGSIDVVLGGVGYELEYELSYPEWWLLSGRKYEDDIELTQEALNYLEDQHFEKLSGLIHSEFWRGYA